MSSKITLSSWQHKKKKRENKTKFKVFGNHDEFLSRINKTLYYGKLPKTERFSLPVTELAAEIFSKARFPGNGVQLRLRPEGKMLGLERLSVGEAGEISRAACISPCSLVLALIYVDRLRDCNPKYLEKASPSKLFVVSMMVASKFLHDDGEDDEVFNDEWAASSGIDANELNCAEREFLAAIDWRVNVKESQFWEWLEAMEEAVAFREGHRKGWFTYSDLNYLLQTKELLSIASALLTVSAVCLTSYTAGVLTILGSTIIVSSLPSPAKLMLHSHNPAPYMTASTSIPLALLFEKDAISDSCSMDSIIQSSTDCILSEVNQSQSRVPNLDLDILPIEQRETWSIFGYMNSLSVPKVKFPEMKAMSSLFNCFNIAAKIFDSFFYGNQDFYTGLLGKKSIKQERLLDLGFCINFFNKKWVVGENISQSLELLTHFLNSDVSSRYENEVVCSSSNKNQKQCRRSTVSVSHHPPFPLGASQY